MWGSLKPVPVTNESLSSIQQADVDRFQLEKNIDDMSEKMRVHSKSSRTQIEALETEVATLRRRLQQQKATAESDQREIQRQLDSEKTLHSESKLQLEATKGALLQLERERSCYGNLHEMMQQQVPDVAAMVDILVANERDENEEKSQRVLKILESKDAMICDLQAALEKQRSELERLTGVIRAQTEQIQVRITVFTELESEVFACQNGEDENRALHNDIELLREQSAANEDNLLQQLETLRSELVGALPTVISLASFELCSSSAGWRRGMAQTIDSSGIGAGHATTTANRFEGRDGDAASCLCDTILIGCIRTVWRLTYASASRSGRRLCRRRRICQPK